MNEDKNTPIEKSGQFENSSSKKVFAQMMDITTESNAELFLDEQSEPHIAFPEKPIGAYRLEGTHFKQWMAAKFWGKHQNGFANETWSAIINTLSGKALHEKNILHQYNRVAKINNTIYYDLGDDQNIVKITSTEWNIQKTCPVKFKRHKHQKIQVLPIIGGQIQDILKYVNIQNNNDQLLFLTYLVIILIPDIPRVLLVITGNQGAAKSTTLRLVRSLIDPSEAELLHLSNDPNTLAQIANQHYCLYFDNLSQLRSDTSDIFCELITGTSFTKRKLYTDDGEIIHTQKSAIGVTGINQIAEKPDLLDRSLILSLERIPTEQRLEESKFWEAFNDEKPYILGAIFTLLSKSLQTINSFELKHKPRMADYAKFAAAASLSMGHTQENFIEAFKQNIARQNEAAIDSSPLAQVIIHFMKDKSLWSGHSTDLYKELSKVAQSLQIDNQSFPRGENWLKRRINSIRINLEALGIEVTYHRDSTANSITLKKHIDQNTSTTPIPPFLTPDCNNIPVDISNNTNMQKGACNNQDDGMEAVEVKTLPIDEEELAEILSELE